jgi:hypothetical protein
MRRQVSRSHMSKVLYTVWYDVDSEIEADWITWMETTHIPAVIRNGNFIGAKRYRVVEGSPARYVTFYEAKDSASLKKYLDGPAKELREDYQKRFGSKSKLTRILLEEISSL